MKAPRFLISLVSLALTTFSAHATMYLLDFGASGTPLTSGYTAVNGNFLADTPTASATGISGTGGAGTIDFSINHVGVYSSGNASEPLTTDGFYTFGNETNNHTFTISGLNAGDQVSLYAVSAWDGNGRGAQVTFGGSTTLAQVVGDPGTAPTLANYTLINSVAAVADGTGILTGSISGHNAPTDEGQVGGFAIVVTPVPEPSTYVTLALAGVALIVFKRRSLA